MTYYGELGALRDNQFRCAGDVCTAIDIDALEAVNRFSDTLKKAIVAMGAGSYRPTGNGQIGKAEVDALHDIDENFQRRGGQLLPSLSLWKGGSLGLMRGVSEANDDVVQAVAFAKTNPVLKPKLIPSGAIPLVAAGFGLALYLLFFRKERR